MSQKIYSARFFRAISGQLEGFGSPGYRTLVNSALDVLWSNTITTPASPDASTVYSITVSGGDLPNSGAAIVVSVTTPGSPTQGGLNALLLAAIRASEVHDAFVSALAGNAITLTSRRLGQSYTLASASNATTTADLVLGTAVASTSSTDIPFGRFVARLTSPLDALNEARLPSQATNLVIQGVTMAPRAAAIKNAVGSNAGCAYYKNEAMDVLTRSNDTTGIWVESIIGITGASTLYIDCTTAGKLGTLTTTATTNLALPVGIGLVSGSIQTPDGLYASLVSLNLP